MPEYYAKQMTDLLAELSGIVSNFENATEEDRDSKGVHPGRAPFLAALRKLMNVIRVAEAAKFDELDTIIEKADLGAAQGIKDAMGSGYDSNVPFQDEDLVPSFAEDENEPVVEDTRKTGLIPPGALMELVRIFSSSGGPGGKGMDLSNMMKEQMPEEWLSCPRPNTLSSACARFVGPIPEWTATSQNYASTSLFQARCEITDTCISRPVKTMLSPSSHILAISTMGDALLDENNGLAFVADDARIKSYRLANAESPDGRSKASRQTRALPVHTFESRSFSGPMTILEKKLLRTGRKGKVGVWDLTSAPTHGKDGSKLLESLSTQGLHNFYLEHFGRNWSLASTSIYSRYYAVWHRTGDLVPCLRQAGGKLATRYLGHGGVVSGFATNPTADPNTFLSWCDDGHARLYDVRSVLPAMTISCSQHGGPVSAGAIAHPDGVPFIFTATTRDEDVKVWDIRSKKLLYELATGNNTVTNLVWDHSANTLYGSTDCFYVDRMGYHHDYRKAKLTRRKSEDDEDDEDDDFGDWEYGWPKKSLHNEDYFGHAFDAGEARLYKYTFKMEPDLEKVPQFGDHSFGQDY
ncbi:hypothetical protein CPB83DRAFT_894455 [Crepidotus variabilis]|uniref:Uncharacterized protein n=1 Tax=Crepidotus variabilis TaxID=179855 RepID=A0A9P6JQB3_9AGAR|nr:hypothetical protein CPB83DRAFT_894455 [Crepidotus variabilis]